MGYKYYSYILISMIIGINYALLIHTDIDHSHEYNNEQILSNHRHKQRFDKI